MRYEILHALRKTGFVVTALSIFATLVVPTANVPNRSAPDNTLNGAETTNLLPSRSKAKEIDPATHSFIAKSYGNLPLSFEINNGQVDDGVKFLSRGSGYTLFLTSTEAVLSVRHGSLAERPDLAEKRPKAHESKPPASDMIRLKPIAANPNPRICGLDELPGKSNYFIGNDPTKWHTDVSNYRKVKIEDIYPGIDLVYYGNRRQLEYDWIVAPGADPQAIKFTVVGKADLKVDAQGDLILEERGEIRLNKPIIYQRRAGAHTEIAGRYILKGKGEVGFQLDNYDASLPLVIDPVLIYSTYLGGNFDELCYGIAVDSSGNAYVTGQTSSSDFPTANAFQPISGSGVDAFVTKIQSSIKVTIQTNPAGLSFAVDGNTYTTPQTRNWTPGSPHTIATTSPQSGGTGSQYVWSSWSDAGLISHSVAPISDTSFTAIFIAHTLTITSPPSGNPNPVGSGGTANLSVSASDSLGHALSYAWTASCPALSGNGSFNNPSLQNPAWTAPVNNTGSQQQCTMQVTVSDGVYGLSQSPSYSQGVVANGGSSVPIYLGPGGAAAASTTGSGSTTQAGYATLAVNSGSVPYATAVFSFTQNGITVTEAGVPASPPTYRARVFIDYRNHVLSLPGQSGSGYIDINTGIAIVNTSSIVANVVYTLRDLSGNTLAIGNGTVAANTHFAKFIDQLIDVAPNFSLPSNFQTATQFGTLEISSNQPLSVLALRGTNNQRNDFLITTTPVADLTQSLSYSNIYFPQFVDGGGYTTQVILISSSGAASSTLSFFY